MSARRCLFSSCSGEISVATPIHGQSVSLESRMPNAQASPNMQPSSPAHAQHTPSLHLLGDCSHCPGNCLPTLELAYSSELRPNGTSLGKLCPVATPLPKSDLHFKEPYSPLVELSSHSFLFLKFDLWLSSPKCVSRGRSWGCPLVIICPYCVLKDLPHIVGPHKMFLGGMHE